MKHYVIYIPGIGDDTKGLQAKLINIWKLFGVQPQVFEMPWTGTESFETKLARLLELIDDLSAKGHKVSLVGASAGAGAAINAFAARKDIITGIVCICGKINNPDAIGPRYRKRNPAFIESAMNVQFSLDKLDVDTDRPRILSRYASLDLIVPRADSIVLGGKNQTVYSVGHSTTIATQLVFGASSYLRFLKRLAK